MTFRPYPRPPTPPRRARWIRPAGTPGTYKGPNSHTGLKVSTSLLGAFVGLAVGAIVFFTVEERLGIAVFCGIAALAFLVTALAPAPMLWGLLVVEVAVLSWTGWQIYDEARSVLAALSTTEGPAAAADAGDLSAAQAQLDAAAAETSFRLDLHEDEVSAVLQDALREQEQPLRRIAVDIVDGPTPTEGTIAFTGEFKSGDYEAAGILEVSLAGGLVQVEVRSMELGSLNLPGFARGAVGDYVDQLLESVEEVNALLAEAEVDVQAITIGGDRLVITGVQRGGPEVTATSLLTDLAAAAAAAGPSGDPPTEVLGPGTVNSTFAEGAVYYLALGDSLAANVGAPDSPGRVRLPGAPPAGAARRPSLRPAQPGGAGRDQRLAAGGRPIGRGPGVPGGEPGGLHHAWTSGPTTCWATSPRRSAAPTSAPPAAGSASTAPSMPTRRTSREMFAALRRAAPQATIVFLKAYNPFSLGTGIAFEAETGFTLDRLNDLAEAAAGPEGILVADGFSPMEGMAAYTTLMLASPPDIHPNALGHDVLAQAVLAALD